MDIHQEIILQNLAKMSACPRSLPGHMRIANGVVQVNHNAGVGRSGGFSELTDGALGLDRYGPSAQVSVSQQWGSDAVANPEDVKMLQDLYRVALGYDPLPDPPSLMPGADSDSAADGSRGMEQKERLLASVPAPGWVHFGCRRDVPNDAVAVARHGKRFAWVRPDGIDGLSQMTLAVLGVIKDTQSSDPSGLAVTGGGG